MTPHSDHDAKSCHRQSIRLNGYDYSLPGAYFITLCTCQHKYLLGEIVSGEMRLNEYGQIVQFTWNDLIHHVDSIELGEFVIMPNHIHGIFRILETRHIFNDSVRAGSEPAPTPSDLTEINTGRIRRQPLSEIVRQFKTFSSRRINEKRGLSGIPVRQRNYWEHIIRDDTEYHNIILYIQTNPAQWERDKLNNQ